MDVLCADAGRLYSIYHSIVRQKNSFKEFIDSKNIQNYPFKEFIHSKKIQNYSFKKSIHSNKSKTIHSKKIFIQVKNVLSPRAKPDRKISFFFDDFP